jgi:ribosomal protein S18 acetylase RimI-like enzyme
MVSIARLQAYLRHSAQQQYETVSVPFFTLFFHPTDALTYFNYGIPDEPCSGGLGASLSVLRDEFAARGRCPRIEFIQEFAPQLARALRAAGFVEEARQQLMVCTAETYRPAPEVLGLTITELTCNLNRPGRPALPASAASEVQDYLNTQRRGFDARSKKVATEGDAEQFLRTIGGGRAFVGWLKGQPVGVGMYTTPFDGVTEIAGLATLEPFRRRGIATRLTALAVQRAMAQGAEVVCLTAADERAGRVYERVGFVGYATMLAYLDSPGCRLSASA